MLSQRRKEVTRAAIGMPWMRSFGLGCLPICLLLDVTSL